MYSLTYCNSCTTKVDLLKRIYKRKGSSLLTPYYPPNVKKLKKLHICKKNAIFTKFIPYLQPF
nr:MAG TPA: hypothetical protein [Caudoviricetes sp.]